jgi:1-phosphatidylinositol phosphodiesterase
MAFYGWPFSQCQPSPSPSNPDPLFTQLRCGIRALDIRLSIVDGELIAFHGLYPQRTPFASILATLHQFLTAPASKSECIIVSIKQEDHASPAFTALVNSTICASAGGAEMWFTQSNRIPMLGEVRGRCVLFSRFGDPDGEGLGIHPDRWPDSVPQGFEWMCRETAVRVSDWCFRFHHF